VDDVVKMLKRFGPARLAAMMAVTLALVGFFAFMMVRFSQPQMALLFSGLTLEDSASVVKELESKAIPFEIRNDGGTIMAPRDQIARIRIQLAEKRLPASGGVGYEIFDKGDSFSATSFMQGINHLRALEGELARTIRAINRVETARVHLVMPERALFSRDREQPSASIVLRLRGEMDTAQIKAIRHLVASAVEGLNPQKVSIIDENGRLLADGATDGPAAMDGMDERRTSFERQMKRQVEEILSSVVGPGRSRVQVAAEMDFNRVQQTQELYDPESRVVRSTQTREENSSTTNNQDGQVSVATEVPGGQTGANENASKDQARKNEEIVNYEISRTTKTETVEGGRVKRLSVAVVVDGQYQGTGTEPTYQPRSQEELDRISALVRSAIGFDKNRGDQVEVINLRFADRPQNVEPAKGFNWMDMFAFGKQDIVQIIETLILLIVSLLVLLLVVRPLVKKALQGDEEGGVGNDGVKGISSLIPEGMTPDQAIAALMGNSPGAQGSPLLPKPVVSDAEEMIERATAGGQMQAQTVQRVANLIERNPQETVAILRQWMADAA
jgi:flagellar M-ring protein FliF